MNDRVFDARAMQARRERAQCDFATADVMRQGWSVSPVDPTGMVDLFPPLRLKPGMRFSAYLFREGGNGNGMVLALPQGRQLADPENGDVAALFDPPLPPEGSVHLLDAIEGDGSPESFFAAAVLYRELLEFGALWHGLTWSTHVLLHNSPLAAGGPVADLAGSFLGDAEAALSLTDPAIWSWEEKAPETWAPRFAVTPEGPVLEFHTISGLGDISIYRHCDRFGSEGLRFTMSERRLAVGPPGYLF